MSLICLISGQLMPNLFSVVLLKPEEVILVHTVDSKEEALYFSAFIKKQKYGVAKTRLIEVKPFNPEEIRQSASELLESIAREGLNLNSCILNYTAGTKPMSIEFVSVFKEAGARLLYIDTQQETCWWTTGNKIEQEPLHVRLNVPEVFALGRGIILGHEQDAVVDTLKELTAYLYEKRTGPDFWDSRLGKWIAESVRLQKEISGWNKADKLASWASGLSVDELNIQPDPAKTTHLHVSFAGTDFQYKKKEFWLTYFTGGWFEQYVYSLIKDTGAYDDVRCNIRLKTKDDDNPQLKNEMDVVAVKNGIPVFVECKTGLVNQKSVTNLKTVTETYGGRYGEAVLVCLSTEIAPAVLERITENGIQLFSGPGQIQRELPALHEYMVVKK